MRPEIRIAGILAKECRGRANAVKSETLGQMVGNHERAHTGTTRQQIRDIIFGLDIPVGACEDGYFVIETEDELDAYLYNLQSRLIGLLRRMKKVRASFYAQDGVVPRQQIELFSGASISPIADLLEQVCEILDE